MPSWSPPALDGPSASLTERSFVKTEEPHGRVPQHFPTVAEIWYQSLDKCEYQSIVDSLGCTQERPVRAPHAPVGRERLKQRVDEWPGVLPRVFRRRALHQAGDLYVVPAARREIEQPAEPRLIKACGRNGASAVVDQHAHA